MANRKSKQYQKRDEENTFSHIKNEKEALELLYQILKDFHDLHCFYDETRLQPWANEDLPFLGQDVFHLLHERDEFEKWCLEQVVE